MFRIFQDHLNMGCSYGRHIGQHKNELYKLIKPEDQNTLQYNSMKETSYYV
jgi:sRNA-binding carbon storage regulator CsrA